MYSQLTPGCELVCVQVPMFVVAKKGLPMDGSSAALLYAYGHN